MKAKSDDIPEEVKRYLDDSSGFFDAEEFFNIANHFETELEIEKVFEVLKRGIKTYPDDINLHLEYIRMLIVSGEFSMAKKSISSLKKSTFLREQSDKLALFTLSAKTNAEECNLVAIKKDIKDFEKYCDGVDYDDGINAAIVISNAYLQSYLTSEAIDFLNIALKIYPNNISLLDALIECTVKDQQDFASSIKICEQAIDTDPYNSVLWHKLGFLNYYNHNIDEAIKAFDYATSIDEEKRESWIAMAECYWDLENYSKAADCFIKGVDINESSDNSTLIKIGNALNNANRFEEARYYFKLALDIDENCVKALFGYGMSYLMNSDNGKKSAKNALFWLKRAINEDESNAFIWSVLGDCYFELDCWGHCIASYIKALNLDNTQFDVLSKLGHAYIMEGVYDEAIQCLNRAKKHSPEFYIINLYLAIAYHSLKDDTNAKYYLMQAMEADKEMEKLFIEYDPDATDIVAEVKKLL